MRGSDRHADFLTTDLLSVWTDPDTAIEVMGTSLGVFADRESSPRRIATEPPLRTALHDMLLDLVERGVLEKRLCTDGRYAFRWRDERARPTAAPERQLAAVSVIVDTSTEPREIFAVDPDAFPRTRPAPRWSRPLAPIAPLVFPASSCLLAILAFLWLGRAVALVFAAALMLVGVVGLVRRVPFAGFWTVGVVIAGLLLRMS